MTVPNRISIVTLGVRDLAISIAFYESLGWQRSATSKPTMPLFRMQGSVLALFERSALANDANTVDDGSGFRAVTLAMNLASPDEVDTVFAGWVSAGARPVVEPHATSWGGYSCYVADVDGHLWDLVYNPNAVIDDHGNRIVDDPAV